VNGEVCAQLLYSWGVRSSKLRIGGWVSPITNMNFLRKIEIAAYARNQNPDPPVV
jgi:hypothetical protein